LIVLKGSLRYIIKVDAYFETKTSKNPRQVEMVYDPGAGTTVISREVALNLGYKIYKGTDPLDGLGGRVNADYAIIPDLILGDVSLGPVYTHVVEFHPELAQRTNALLGMNVLSWFKITQDCHWNEESQLYTSATLVFEPKYDLNDKISLDKFHPLDRGQRFGTVFHVDRPSSRISR